MSRDRQPYLQSQRPFSTRNRLTSLSCWDGILFRDSLTAFFVNIPSLDRYSTINSISSFASSGLTLNKRDILSNLTACRWRFFIHCPSPLLLVSRHVLLGYPECALLECSCPVQVFQYQFYYLTCLICGHVEQLGNPIQSLLLPFCVPHETDRLLVPFVHILKLLTCSY